MQRFLKKTTDWILEKEGLPAKTYAVPLREIDAPLQQVQKQKAKIQKIRRTEVQRCQNKEV